jgi:hypothetical protein
LGRLSTDANNGGHAGDLEQALHRLVRLIQHQLRPASGEVIVDAHERVKPAESQNDS